MGETRPANIPGRFTLFGPLFYQTSGKIWHIDAHWCRKKRQKHTKTNKQQDAIDPKPASIQLRV
jgi:hypothetical protein